ncbi:MAG TPA: response regulator [Bryobacteraceae bacterium]|nr:response regulator [Bryobacteraceae bacterium]
MALSFETILVVEDHSALLRLVKQILEDAGFTVIPATTAKQALRLEAEYPGTIDLLLSDVRMRGMSGPTLAQRLKEKRPQMRVMLMSGYPGGDLLVLEYGWHYIEKPFVPSALVSKIKEVLRGEVQEQAAGRSNGRNPRRRPVSSVAPDFRSSFSSGMRRGA